MKKALWLSFLIAAGCNGKEFTEEHNGQSVEVEVGTEFSLRLAASAGNLPPEYQFERLPPRVQGEAVAYLGHAHKGPDSGAPGSRGRDIYRFRAAKAGQAEIRIFRRKLERREEILDYKSLSQ